MVEAVEQPRLHSVGEEAAAASAAASGLENLNGFEMRMTQALRAGRVCEGVLVWVPKSRTSRFWRREMGESETMSNEIGSARGYGACTGDPPCRPVSVCVRERVCVLTRWQVTAVSAIRAC